MLLEAVRGAEGCCRGWGCPVSLWVEGKARGMSSVQVFGWPWWLVTFSGWGAV